MFPPVRGVARVRQAHRCDQAGLERHVEGDEDDEIRRAHRGAQARQAVPLPGVTTVGMVIVSPTSSHLKEQHQAEATAVFVSLLDKVVADILGTML